MCLQLASVTFFFHCCIACDVCDLVKCDIIASFDKSRPELVFIACLLCGKWQRPLEITLLGTTMVDNGKFQ